MHTTLYTYQRKQAKRNLKLLLRYYDENPIDSYLWQWAIFLSNEMRKPRGLQLMA